MRLFQAALDTCLGSPFFASLSVHGLHFTVYAPSRKGSFEPNLKVFRTTDRVLSGRSHRNLPPFLPFLKILRIQCHKRSLAKEIGLKETLVKGSVLGQRLCRTKLAHRVPKFLPKHALILQPLLFNFSLKRKENPQESKG